MSTFFTENMIIDGRFHLLSRLGEGGMGAVFLALDKQLDRKVAIKVLKDDVSKDTEVYRRTLSEGKILSTLRHPSLSSIYEVNIDSGSPYIVQEYIEGDTIRGMLQKGITFSLNQTWIFLKEQAEVLAFIHEQNIVHRDIKPENIMRDKTGRSLLMDFGLAIRPDSTRITQEGAFVGTLAYCPPEFIRGKDATPASDIFQLSLVTYEAITGRNCIGSFKTPGQFIDLLFKSDWHKTILKSGIPRDLAEIICHGASFDPEKRPSDGTALLKIVENQFNSRDRTPFELKVPSPAPSTHASTSTMKTAQKTVAKIGKTVDLTYKTQTRPTIEKTTKRWVTRPLILFFLVVAFFTTIIVVSHTGNPAIKEHDGNSIVSNARAFVLLPDGFYGFFQSNAGKDLSWSVSSKDGIEICRNNFTRVAGGWSVCLRSEDLHGGDEIILKFFDNGQVRETTPLTLPETFLKSPLRARFSYDSIVTKWELYGQSEVELVFEDSSELGKGSAPVFLKEMKGSNTNTIEINTLDFKGEIKITLRLPDADKTVLGTVSGKPEFRLVAQLDPENPSENIKDDTAYTISDIDQYGAGTKLISLMAVKDKRLYFATQTGFLYSMKINSSSSDLCTLLWKKSFRTIPDLQLEKPMMNGKPNKALEASSLRPFLNGVEVYGLGDGDIIYCYSKDGTCTKTSLPIADVKGDVSPLPEFFKPKIFEFPQGILYSLYSAMETQTFFINKKNTCKKVLCENKDVSVRKAFHGLGKLFAWVYMGQKQAFVELLEEEEFVRATILVSGPFGNERKQFSTAAFDNKVHCGLLAFGGNLYSLVMKEGKCLADKLSKPKQLDTTAYTIIRCGDGRFVFPGAQFTLPNPLINKVSANLKIVQVVLGNESPVFTVFETGISVLMGTNSQDFKVMKKINNSRAIFTVDGQAFIIDTNECNIIYHQNFYSSPDWIYAGDDFILLSKTYYGVIEGIPLN